MIHLTLLVEHGFEPQNEQVRQSARDHAEPNGRSRCRLRPFCIARQRPFRRSEPQPCSRLDGWPSTGTCRAQSEWAAQTATATFSSFSKVSERQRVAAIADFPGSDPQLYAFARQSGIHIDQRVATEASRDFCRGLNAWKYHRK